MNRHTVFIITIYVLLIEFSPPSFGQAFPEFSVEPIPDYDALFDRNEGWTGADGAYTVPLGCDTTLWLFSDTWVGHVREGKHVDSTMINNSVGVQAGKDIASATVRFHYGKKPDGKPDALILPADGHGWFWLFHGAHTSKGLYLFLMQVEKTDDRSVFGFQHAGMWLGHVENPTDSPNDWRVTQRKIPFDRPSPKGNQTFGSAVLKHDGFIYIYGIDEEKKLGFLNRFMTVARVDEATIGDYDTWRFYRDGAWQDDWIKSGRIFNGIATEYSVSYQPSLKKFIVVYTENGMSENILIRLADHPWGPWSDPATIYRCPEAGWDSSYFCYAAKGHPSLSKPNELIIAYVTNSFDFGKMVSDARIYRPRFLRLTFK